MVMKQSLTDYHPVHALDPTTPIAFLGMGLMGSRMARRLLQAGFSVAVYNRTRSACDALVAAGATGLNMAHIADYPFIMLCLADDGAVQDVLMQIEPYLRHGQIIIDFSSLSVAATQRYATMVAALGVQWLDVPVSGGVIGAEHGSLVMFAGGDAATIEQVTPLLAPLAQRVTRMGDVGSGQATKICNQLIVAASSTLIAEAVALAQAAGVDANILASALAGGFADSKPLQILAPRMASRCFEPLQWKVATLHKDLNNALNLAHDYQLNLRVAPHARDVLAQHDANGFAEHDLSTLIVSIDDMAHPSGELQDPSATKDMPC